jgi:hypothetical protein
MQSRTPKILSILACLTAVGSLSIVSVNAQDTTDANLVVTGGSLTMYAGDANDNNDLCAPADTSTRSFIQDDGTTTSVTCGTPERSVSLSSISVLSTRQNTTTTINDVLCEDLTGSTDNNYSVAATIGNLINQGAGSDIELGVNPDGATLETAADTDAPINADAGKLYATYTPGSAIKSIAPESARTVADVDFTPGSKTTTVNTATSIGIYSASATAARRFDSDTNTLKYRIPSFPNASNYVGGVTYTCTAS